MEERRKHAKVVIDTNAPQEEVVERVKKARPPLPAAAVVPATNSCLLFMLSLSVSLPVSACGVQVWAEAVTRLEQ